MTCPSAILVENGGGGSLIEMAPLIAPPTITKPLAVAEVANIVFGFGVFCMPVPPILSWSIEILYGVWLLPTCAWHDYHAFMACPPILAPPDNHIIVIILCGGNVIEGILHCDLSITQVMIVHTFNCQIVCLTRIKRHEPRTEHLGN